MRMRKRTKKRRKRLNCDFPAANKLAHSKGYCLIQFDWYHFRLEKRTASSGLQWRVDAWPTTGKVLSLFSVGDPLEFIECLDYMLGATPENEKVRRFALTELVDAAVRAEERLNE